MVPIKSIFIGARLSPFSLVGCKEQKQKIQIKGKAKQIGFLKVNEKGRALKNSQVSPFSLIGSISILCLQSHFS